MKDFIKINENDNVIVALKELTAGRPFWREHRRLQQGKRSRRDTRWQSAILRPEPR